MATTNSNEYAAALVTKPASMQDTSTWQGNIKFYFFSYTQSGIATIGDLMRTVKLPGGKSRLILSLSRIYHSAGGTGSTMDLGWEAYTDLDGNAVAADPNGIDDGIDSSAAAAVNPGGTIGTHETKVFESKDGVVLTTQVNDTAFPDAGTISGYWAVVHE